MLAVPIQFVQSWLEGFDFYATQVPVRDGIVAERGPVLDNIERAPIIIRRGVLF